MKGSAFILGMNPDSCPPLLSGFIPIFGDKSLIKRIKSHRDDLLVINPNLMGKVVPLGFLYDK